jgi:hypothetical protein
VRNKSGYIPVLVQQRRKFEAPNPWDPTGEVVTWKLGNYEFQGFGPESLSPGIAKAAGKEKPHMLPLALTPLLEEGVLKPEQLPDLLHGLKKELRKSDYPPRKASHQDGMAVMLVALLPLWLAWEIGFQEEEKLFPLLVGAIGAFLLLLGVWTFAQAPLRRFRERRLAARLRRRFAPER